jgi:hypothetical protein
VRHDVAASARSACTQLYCASDNAHWLFRVGLRERPAIDGCDDLVGDDDGDAKLKA